jgi:hypothetical protein
MNPPRGQGNKIITERGKTNTERHRGIHREPQRITDPELQDHKREKVY